MIVKRVAIKPETDNVIEQARYALHLPKGIHPTEWERIAHYILDNNRKNIKRLDGWRITNCESNDLGLAAIEIRSTQALNTRSKAEKVYHMVFSFRDDEVPTKEQLTDIEDTLCTSIGYADHQRLSAVHRDTNNFHVHVIINKVHPTTYRNFGPYFDKITLQKTAKNLEIKHGLRKDNHEKKNTANSIVADIEARSGQLSFLTWIKNEAAADLKEALNWQDLHTCAVKYSLRIKKHGAGLVIGRSGKGRSLYVKASDVHKSLSFGSLEKKLGEFESPQKTIPMIKSEKKYQASPIQKHPNSSDLFKQYQDERKNSLATRTNLLKRLDVEDSEYITSLKDWYEKKRQFIKFSYKNPLQRKKAYQVLSEQQTKDLKDHLIIKDQKKQEIRNKTPLLRWNQYLIERAENGDEIAVAILRSNNQKNRRFISNLLGAKNTSEMRHIIMAELSPKVLNNGDVRYFLKDGSEIQDTKNNILIKTESTSAYAVALILASEKFLDQPISVQGNEKFMQQIAQLAGMKDFPIHFSDSKLETLRKNYLHTQKINKDKSLSLNFIFETPEIKDKEEILNADTALASALPTHQQAISEYIATRNKLRTKIVEIPLHREWTPKDIGSFKYAGRRRLGSGGEVILLKRFNEMLVKLIAPTQVKSRKIKVGESISIHPQENSFDNQKSRR